MTENNSEEFSSRRSQEEDGGDFVPTGFFGNDHWGVFLRVEEAALRGGKLNLAQLNIAYSKRPSFTPPAGIRATNYPTQIKMSETVRGDGRHGVRKVTGHDDVDCLGDLERAGLVDAVLPEVHQDHFVDADGSVIHGEDGSPLSPFISPELLESDILKHTKWSLTEYGAAVASQLKKYREAGKTLHSFVPVSPTEVAQVF